MTMLRLGHSSNAELQARCAKISGYEHWNQYLKDVPSKMQLLTDLQELNAAVGPP